MNYNNYFINLIRNFARFTKLNLLLYKLFYGSGYEHKINLALKKYIKKKDIVWDIGANVGLYTSLFSNLVGKKGKVFAFEPHPKTFMSLKKCSLSKNIKFLNFALGNENKTKHFSDLVDKNVLNKIVDNSYSEKKITINMRTSDYVVKNKIADIPNFIKIDVEGFEYFVILGMDSLLNNSFVSTILIEVHFSALREIGLSNAHKEISIILIKKGFKLTWLDPSHILAKR